MPNSKTPPVKLYHGTPEWDAACEAWRKQISAIDWGLFLARNLGFPDYTKIHHAARGIIE
jgi:hypothetical protein